MLRYILIGVLVTVALTHVSGQSPPAGDTGKNIDDLIKDVFTTPDGGIPTPNVQTNTGGGTQPQQPPPVTQKPPPTGIIDPVGASDRPCDGGECVQFFLCDGENKLITNGEGLLDIRFDPDEMSKPDVCTNYLEACCALSNKKDTSVLNPVTVKQGCGNRNVDGVGFRITGDKDHESQYAEFPWMVAILKEEKTNNQVLNVFQCGGSLIHPSVVLTAAHCVQGKNPNDLKIRAGEWDTQTKNEIWPHQDRDVAEIVVHKDYYKGALFNDIALMFLTTPVELAENVQTVCLPPQNNNFDSSRCTVSGWGKDVFGKEGKYQVILKKIDLPIVPRPKCQQALRTTRLGKFFELHNSFICAGGEPGKDACKGDGGSPLVCPIPGQVNRYYQAGIVAWGIGCGENQIPGVYANVALFRNWINEQLQYKNFDQSYFTPN